VTRLVAVKEIRSFLAGGVMRTGNHSFVIIVLNLLLVFVDLPAQYNFNRIYGGSGGEQAYAVRQTYDGGYIFTGFTTSYGAGYNDIWLVKLVPTGDTLWTKTYGFDLIEEAYSVKQTPDSGFIILGKTTTASNGLYNDFWLLKTDQIGDTIWTKFFGDLWEQETPSEVITTLDGGFALVGKDPDFIGNRSVWLIKTNSMGDTSWTQKFGGPYDEAPNCIIQTSDEGYLIGGCISLSVSLSDQDFYLIKTDVLGDTLWTRIYDNADNDCVMSIVETEDGGYLIAGHTDHYYNGFSYDIWLLKLDSNGDSQWSRFYGNNEDEYANSIHPSEDGGFVISGKIFSNNFANDGILLLKINAEGDTTWTRRYGAESIDAGTDAYPAKDGGFILCGYTNSFGANVRDAWIIKTDYLGYITDLSSNKIVNPQQFQLYQNYPNPFNPVTMIRYQLPMTSNVDLSVYNLLGQKVAILVSQKENAGSHQIEWDATGFASGVYYYHVVAGNYREVKKMILIR
jgi:hypothetical protein